MAKKREQLIRMQAKFLRITENLHFPLNDLKKLILRQCPDGFRAWLRKERRTIDFEKFRDAEKRDLNDKARGKDKKLRKYRKSRSRRNRD